jgi:hypothetical protein
MILKTNLNAINAFNAAMQTNYAANAAPFLQLITDFDKTAKDSTKLRIYKKEIAIFEPLAAKNSIAFQPTLTELYLYYGDVLAHDTLRKAEAAAMYEKGVAMTIPLYENYPQSYGGILQTVCGTVASYYTNEKQIDKAIAIYTTMIEKTKKVYQAEHKGNEYYLLLAYNNLSSLYKAELYDKDNAEYRKKAKIMLAEMDKIVVEGGLDFQPFYKQMEEDKYEGDEDEYTIESFVPTMYRLKNFFELTSPADALLIGQLTDIRTKLDSAKTEERHEECIRLLNEDLKISAILVKNIKYSNTFEAQAADSNGSLSWQLLFTKQYAASEAAAKVAIAYKDPKTKEASAEWANTNLAIAYILQDKYSDALKIYKKYKGKIYGLTDANWTETFLQDLDTMEKSGITHKDFAQARKYLQK